MKRYYLLISLSLLTGLFIYIFYRTEHTVINILLHKLSRGSLHQFRIGLRAHLKLPASVVFSLPEGLWVFAATLTSKHLYCIVYKKRIHLSWLPMSYAVLLECLQLMHIMPGRFDVLDLFFSLCLGLWALRKIECPLPPQYLSRQFNYRTLSVVYIYAIVFLSHVSRTR